MKTAFIVSLLLAALSSHGQEEGEWDNYMAQYDGGVGSVLLDMSLKKTAPINSLHYVLVTGVTYKNCGPDGMPKADELKNLHAISDSIQKLLKGTVKHRLAGTFTHKCQRLDYYYIVDTTNLRSRLKDFYQKRFPLYEPYINMKEDGSWKYYLDFLYPSNLIQEYMKNDKVVRKLFEAGDKLEKPRQVDHWIYFESPEGRERFIQYAVKQKFKVEKKDKIPGNPFPYSLQISRIDLVNVGAISQITIELGKQAEVCKGRYDGWETFLIKE